MTSSLALWWCSLPKLGCEPIPCQAFSPTKRNQSIFVHELNSKALCRGRKLYYMCTFSTHYRAVMADLSEMTEKRPKWTLRRLFSTACPSWTHCDNYVKMYLRQLGRKIKHLVFIWQLRLWNSTKINQKAEISSLGGAESPSATAGWRQTRHCTEHQTTSVPAISGIHAFPWSSTTIFNDLHRIPGLCCVSLVSPHPSSVTRTSDKYQVMVLVGTVFLKTFTSFFQRG